jgi:hypothetical protein
MPDVERPLSEPLATEYQLRPLGPEHATDWHLWTVYVRPFGGDMDRWCVKTMFEGLTHDGEWAPLARVAPGTWPLADAVAMAREAQWTYAVDGKTAGDVIDAATTKETDHGLG